MIWRWGEGHRLRYGLNWSRDARTYLEVMLFWRGLSHYYSMGVRFRRPRYGHVVILRRLRRSCMRCDAFNGLPVRAARAQSGWGPVTEQRLKRLCVVSVSIMAGATALLLVLTAGTGALPLVVILMAGIIAMRQGMWE